MSKDVCVLRKPDLIRLELPCCQSAQGVGVLVSKVAELCSSITSRDSLQPLISTHLLRLTISATMTREQVIWMFAVFIYSTFELVYLSLLLLLLCD